MSKAITKITLNPKKPPKLSKKQKARLALMTDDDIDYSDIPDLDADFFRLADALTPKKKQSLTIRLDEEVVTWLKSQGGGYQSRINAMLKAAMLMQTGKR